MTAQQHPTGVSGVSPDAGAAHDFLSELRTRIAVQPLPYQHGAERQALESLWQLFVQAREAMKKYPGCKEFAAVATRALNVDLRPVTAKWDRARGEGRLDSRDGADEFRADLLEVQLSLRRLSTTLHMMAYGAVDPADQLTPPVFTQADLDVLCADLPFGILPGQLIEPNVVVRINEVEAREVHTRRGKYDIDTPAGKNAVGLALSGGGIRSATFCLGVVQVLAQRELLKDVDFLSTVSGGGYTGSFISSRLGSPGATQAEIAGPEGPDPTAIRFLRHHAKYLAAVDLKSGWEMATATLAGMLLNWSAPLFLVAAAALIAIRVPALDWPRTLAGVAIVTMLLMVLYALLIRRSARAARAGGAALGLSMAAVVAIAFGWLLTIIYGAHWPSWKISGGIAAAIAAAAPAILRFVPVIKTPAVRRIALPVLLWIVGLLIPIGVLALFLGTVYFGSLESLPPLEGWGPIAAWSGFELLAALAVLLWLVAVFVLNINLTSPHRLYRDALARTFIWKSEEDSAPVRLADLNPSGLAPYHLINTTVNLPSSQDAALRDRKSDFFLFSKHWCGSPVVRYQATAEWKTNASAPDLATAMAISGAAASSHMGLESKPSLVALITFLNIRLGFWIRRPGTGWLSFPGFTCLIREMLGIFMSEQRAWLNLSDGGHIENMGAYELLRRRCKYVLCVDGEADGAYTFQGLMTLVRHAQLDFGVRIDVHLDAVRPDPKLGYSQGHSALAVVHYPDAGPGRPAAKGLLLYLKLSVTGNEPELIRRYRTLWPDFPHQSTIDQFFTEEQFEAYRELGVHVASGLFSKVLMNGGPSPQTIPDWFRRLAGNLLEPEL